jgi:hypothetical protein
LIFGIAAEYDSATVAAAKNGDCFVRSRLVAVRAVLVEQVVHAVEAGGRRRREAAARARILRRRRDELDLATGALLVAPTQSPGSSAS